MLSLDATVHALRLATPFAACVSGVSVLAAMSGTAWLASQERVPNPAFRNGSSKVEFLTKCTISGLFTFCVTEAGETEFSCSKIDFFPLEAYSPDPQDATMAIPHTVTKSVWFFLTAAALLGAAEVLCLHGHCCSRRRFLTFLSGLTFILAGLVMLVGLVMYIATLKGLVADKLRRRSPFQPAPFTYSYGWCFLLVMLGFLTSEAAGMAAIFLYIYRHKREWRQKQQLVRGGPSSLTLPRSPSRRTRGQYLLEYLPLPYHNHADPNHQGPPRYRPLPQDHTCHRQGMQDPQTMAPNPPSQETCQPPEEGTGVVAGASGSGQPRTRLRMDVSRGDASGPALHPRQGGPQPQVRGSHGKCESCSRGACRGGGTLPRTGSWGTTSHSRDGTSSLPRTGLKLRRSSSSSPPATGIPDGGRCEDCSTCCCYCCCCCCCCCCDEADCPRAFRTPLPTSKWQADPSSGPPGLPGSCLPHHASPGPTQHRPRGCQHPQQQTHWFRPEGTDGGAPKPHYDRRSQRRTTPVRPRNSVLECDHPLPLRRPPLEVD